jgi:predicted nucleotidyltransferase
MGTNERLRDRRDRSITAIADALFTKGQQRVLGVLFLNPSRSFYANEIIGLVGAGTGAVQRELARLEAGGLVTVSRIGKQKHYQANPASPVFEELRGLVLKTAGLGDVLRASLAPFAQQIRAAFVFGSVAKNQDAVTSDIDLMVVSDTVTYAELFPPLSDAEIRLGRKVNPKVYTPSDLRRRLREGNSFVTRVLAQPKIWLVGEADDLPA